MRADYYKDPSAFVQGDSPCYQPAGRAETYTRGDFLRMAEGDAAIAQYIFDQAAGEPPDELVIRLKQAAPASAAPSLPLGNLDGFVPFADTQGHYANSASLDYILNQGGAPLALALQDMLDGQYGAIFLYESRPGVLCCRPFPVAGEAAATAMAMATQYAALAAKYPEAGIFIDAGLPSSYPRLCLWLEPGRLTPDRHREMQFDLRHL